MFRIDINEDNSSFFNLEQTYKYVHLKIKPIEEKKKSYVGPVNIGSGNSFVKQSLDLENHEYLIQIIDISDRMLYNDAKAE